MRGARCRRLARLATLFLVAVVPTLFLVGVVPSVGLAIENASEEKTAADLFQISKVWSLHLNMPADEWIKMEPQGNPHGGPPPGDFPPPGDPPPPRDALPNPAQPARSNDRPAGSQRPAGTSRGPGGFGPMRPMEFPFARARVEFEGRTYADVGVRFKGNSSYMSSVNSLKKSLKLDFDRYQDQQRFYGLSKINLNNNTMDPSQMREAIAYDVFRRAEVPAPRTTYVKLFLTVPGKYDRKYIGLYTLIEQVDTEFLQDRFGTKKGLLLKPRIGRVLPYLGEQWNDYQSSYAPKSGASKAATERLMAFAKLVQEADDATFRREIESFMNVDEFLKFIALNGILGNLDSILAMGQNYYMYLEPASNKFVWIPWDLNLALAGFPLAGNAAQQMDLSIRHPHSGEIKIIERVLAVKEFDEIYRRQLREILASNFTVDRVGGLIDQIAPTIREAVQDDTHLKLAAFERAVAAEDAATPPATDAESLVAAAVSRVRDALPGPPFRRAPALRPFVAGRVTSLSAQLDGNSDGYVPVRGPGLGGFGPGRFLGAQILTAADTDKSGQISPPEFEALAKRWLTAWDEDKSGSLSGKEIAEGLNESFGPPPGFGRPGHDNAGINSDAGINDDDLPVRSPSGRRRPPFGPGMFIAPQLLKLADRDGDSQLTLGELDALFVMWSDKWEKNNDGGLDADELDNGLGKTLTPPRGPGFRPRGGAR